MLLGCSLAWIIDFVHPTRITGIVPPVRNVRVYIETNVFNRAARELPWVEARQRWWLRLRFKIDLDLVIFEHVLRGSILRFIEFQGSHYLEHPEIPDWAEFNHAYSLAQAALARLNGRLKLSCPPFRGVILENLAELFESGTGREGAPPFIMLPPTTSDINTIIEVFRCEPSQLFLPIPLLGGDPNIQEALFYLGSEDNGWFELYKAGEIVSDSVGGVDAIVQKGWCSKKAWKRFTRTANHQDATGGLSRHARSKEQSPPDPMTLLEAQRFLTCIVGRWVRSEIAQKASS